VDPDPYSSFVLLSVLKPWDFGIIFVILAILLLLVFSALISGSEVAYFALSPKDRETLEDENSKSSKQVIDLLSRPKALLATILIGNNLVNVAIIILSSYLMELVFDFSGRELRRNDNQPTTTIPPKEA
jgi:putative hemolysin